MKIPRERSPVARDPRYRSRQWQAIRLYIIARDGGCVVCRATTRLEVDHIIRPEDGGSFFDEANLRTLCALHHRRRTARALMARRGRRPRTKRLRRW
jgi:5-methylcytosine-specific restriction endonuclease McrA